MRRLNTLTFRKAAMRSIAILAVLASALVVGGADCFGAIILHVDTGDSVDRRATGISSVLTADGHEVTSITDQAAAFAALNDPSLGNYDLVIWDKWHVEEGPGPDPDSDPGPVSQAVASLTNFVQMGGKLLVIGFDSALDSPPVFYSLLGGTGASDAGEGDDLNAVVNESNSLTRGLVDIRGLTPVGVSSSPSSYKDLDALDGLAENTTAIVTSASGNHWTLRQLGLGEVAFISTPRGFNFADDDPVYRDALRNFAYSANFVADPPPTTPEPATLAIWAGLSAVGLIAARRKQKATA